MNAKEVYEKALKEMNDAFYGITFLNSQTRRFDDNLNLLRELVNEHFEEKQETNFEHYYEYFSEVGLGGFALVNGRCTECSGTCCSECDFSGDCSSNCNEKRLRWLASTYIKKYKLTQFEYDLIQTYSDYGDYKLSKFNRLIELKDKGHFKDVDKEAIINEILSDFEVKDRNEGKND